MGHYGREYRPWRQSGARLGRPVATLRALGRPSPLWQWLIAIYITTATLARCEDVPKETFRFTVSPRVAIKPFSQAVEAYARVLVKNPSTNCYAVGVDWGDGSRSFEESTCDPYGLLPAEALYPKRHWYDQRGTFTVTFVLGRLMPDGKFKLAYKGDGTIEIR